MKDYLRQLLGKSDDRKPADESLFLSQKNYLGVQLPQKQDGPQPTDNSQVGATAGLVTIIDGDEIIKLAPSEVYEGGIRIIPGPAPTFTGLLDDYPGAAAAFSLRRLSVNYTGPLVQVRRASDNDETTIPYKDDGTLDVGVLNAFAAGTDAFVSEWPDQSSNANDATQTTTANQPKIYDSVTGVVTENGKPAILFSVSTTQRLGLSLVEPSADFMVSFLANVPLDKMPLGKNGLSVDSVQYRNNDTTIRVRYANAVDFTGGTDLSGRQVLLGIQRASGNFELYENSSSIGTSSTANAFAVDSIGNGYQAASSVYTGGAIQELVIWEDAQTSNRAGIESNINTYYSIY